MFPLRDTVRPRSRPYITWTLIAFSLAIFMGTASLQPGLFERLVRDCGLVPARVSFADPGSWLTLVPLILLPWLVEIPAFIYLGIWFLSQVSSVLLNLGAAGDFGGIAWWAHIGRFAFGALWQSC